MELLLKLEIKANTIDEIEGQFMGLIKIKPTGWGKIAKYLREFSTSEIDQMDMTMLLSGLINYGVEVSATPISDRWMEVDSESDLLVYKKEL